ncbi:MAG: hypothetical protein QOH71_662 [Blastocatellia bacterium]|jgi:hypothetical protein|nr:hypothetical protein [Blastocatellia bacterium]
MSALHQRLNSRGASERVKAGNADVSSAPLRVQCSNRPAILSRTGRTRRPRSQLYARSSLCCSDTNERESQINNLRYIQFC